MAKLPKGATPTISIHFGADVSNFAIVDVSLSCGSTPIRIAQNRLTITPENGNKCLISFELTQSETLQLEEETHIQVRARQTQTASSLTIAGKICKVNVSDVVYNGVI